MVTQVTMPKLAENAEEATIGQWFKQEGERVAEGEPLFEAITDKAAVEVKAEGNGILRKVYARENSVVPVGRVIAVIAEADEELPAVAAVPLAPKPAAPSAIKASFGARRLAKELGVDLANIVPSRPDGSITEDDVRRAAARVEGPAVLERIPLSPLKRALADHLRHVTHNVAAAFVALETDFSAVEAALPKLGERAGLTIHVRDVVLHAAARLLPRFRLLNACFTENGIVVYQPVNIGLASDVGRDDSVMVPVVREADRKSLTEVARETAGLLDRLAAHALKPSDLADATFTLADQSALGIDHFVPILNDRQSAVLGISSIRQRVVPRGGQAAIAPVANLVVAFDHRVLNATTAARFLKELRDSVECFRVEAVP
jgi:pyruvate dehydrogenase E2 component (dihydrolipoamide acetyltransferase)